MFLCRAKKLCAYILKDIQKDCIKKIYVEKKYIYSMNRAVIMINDAVENKDYLQHEIDKIKKKSVCFFIVNGNVDIEKEMGKISNEYQIINNGRVVYEK